MGQYVYRVTKEKITIKGITAQVAVFAYKPTYHYQQVGNKCLSPEQINNRWAFKTGCMARTKIDTDYIVLTNDERTTFSIYKNPNKLRTFLDDSTLGTDKMPFVESIEC